MKHSLAAPAAALAVAALVAMLVMSVRVGFQAGEARAAFPGQNGKLAFYWTREVWVANADGSNATQLTSTFGIDRSPRWSPDGTRIAFASERNGSGNSKIFVMNADGSDQRRLTVNPARDRLSTWTADGTQVVYDKEFSEIYAINADGSGGERKLADGLMPSASPYGNRLVFSVGGGGLVTMNLDGSDRRQVTPAGNADFSATWSPGGTDLVFTRPSGEDRDVYRVHANGVGLVRLTNTPSRSEVGPVWSPDGTKIAFVGCANPLGSVPDCGIYAINRDGSGETQVSGVNASFAEAPVDWQPMSPFPRGNEPVTLTVSVVASGGTGVVTSVPEGLQCPPVCSTEFDRGSTVRLEARPSGNAAFLGWTGACSGRSASCTVLMDGEKRIGSSFGRRTLKLTVSVTRPGTCLEQTGEDRLHPALYGLLHARHSSRSPCSAGERGKARGLGRCLHGLEALHCPDERGPVGESALSPLTLSAADRLALGGSALVFVRPLEELEDVTVGVEEEDLGHAVASRHRATCQRYAGLGKTCAGGSQVVDLEREVMGKPVRRAVAGVCLTRTAGRVCLRQEMQLVIAEPEPRAGEGEVRRARYLLEPQRTGIETPRALEIRDHETHVLEAHRHDAYRNLALSRKEEQCR